MRDAKVACQCRRVVVKREQALAVVAVAAGTEAQTPDSGPSSSRVSAKHHLESQKKDLAR